MIDIDQSRVQGRGVTYPSGHGHACSNCAGVGTVRQRGRPGGERIACPRCGGSGHLRSTR